VQSVRTGLSMSHCSLASRVASSSSLKPVKPPCRSLMDSCRRIAGPLLTTGCCAVIAACATSSTSSSTLSQLSSVRERLPLAAARELQLRCCCLWRTTALDGRRTVPECRYASEKCKTCASSSTAKTEQRSRCISIVALLRKQLQTCV
jgi:hypothetical protein